MPYNCIIITSSIVATVCLHIAGTIMMTGVIRIISNVLRVVALCSLRRSIVSAAAAMTVCIVSPMVGDDDGVDDGDDVNYY